MHWLRMLVVLLSVEGNDVQHSRSGRGNGMADQDRQNCEKGKVAQQSVVTGDCSSKGGKAKGLLGNCFNILTYGYT